MKSIIHINQHVIKSNHTNGENKPCITVKTYNSNRYGHEVIIDGPSKVVYNPTKPLPCGARCWIETYAEVSVINNEDNETDEWNRRIKIRFY